MNAPLNPHRTFITNADRAFAAFAKQRPDIGELIDGLTLEIAERFIASGIPDQLAWAAADASHRAISASLTARLGYQNPVANRLTVIAASRPVIDQILSRWLPDGVREGLDYVGSDAGRDGVTIRVGRVDGSWLQTDHGAEPSGGPDLISLAVYLFDISEEEAARRIGAMLHCFPTGRSQ